MMMIHNTPITDHDLIAMVESTFLSQVKHLTKKKQQPHRVKLNGKYIVTNSKKTIWPNIGAAKNAVRNHFNGDTVLAKWIRKIELQNAANNNSAVSVYYSYHDIEAQIVKYLEANGFIEYVPYTEGE